LWHYRSDNFRQHSCIEICGFYCTQGHHLQAEITVNTKLVGDEHTKAKRNVWEQNETTQSVSTANIQKNETVAGQDDR
jgi:hypothetical protein